MKLTGEVKFFLGAILATAAIIAVGVYFTSKPAPSFSREELLPSDTVIKGNKEAKVYLVEFSDFECPACRTFKPTIDELVKKHADSIAFGYRHFPLPQHTRAQDAAMAAEAAGEQGKFWEMHDYLFEKEENLSKEAILDGAKKLSLDMEKFQKSLESEEFKKKIARDMSDGNRFGVSATPTLFLNGMEIAVGPLESLEKEIAKVTGQ